jgi:transposase-like protein
MKTLLNEAMKAERNNALKAEPYERTEDRQGYANGFKDKTLNMRMGEVKIQVPQVRGLSFYPQCIEKGVRSERALKIAIAEMYIKGVSTRKVDDITEKLCGHKISSTQVSRLSKLMDKEIESFMNRPLESYPCLIIDARYEKIRYGGVVRDLAVLIAIGVNNEGKREILGLSTSLSEAELHWRKFLKSLVYRGLCGVDIIVSDDHLGLKEARKKVFPSVPWQRCVFHLLQNASAYAPSKKLKKEIVQATKDILYSSSLELADEKKKVVIRKYKKKAPDFVTWLEDNIDEGLTCLSFPMEHWRRLRSTNLLERLNQEIKRRTRVARIFPNEMSCFRLIAAILMETHEEWINGRKYMDFNKCKLVEYHDSEIYRKKVA